MSAAAVRTQPERSELTTSILARLKVIIALTSLTDRLAGDTAWLLQTVSILLLPGPALSCFMGRLCSYRADDGCYRVDEYCYRADECCYCTDDGCYRIDACCYRADDDCYRVDDGCYRTDACYYRIDTCCYRADACCHKTDDGCYSADDFADPLVEWAIWMKKGFLHMNFTGSLCCLYRHRVADRLYWSGQIFVSLFINIC